MLNYVGPGNLDGSWPGDAHTISLTSSCLLHSSDVSGLGGKRSTARGIARKDMKGYERIWKDGGRARNCALSVSGQTSEVWSDILVREHLAIRGLSIDLRRLGVELPQRVPNGAFPSIHLGRIFTQSIHSALAALVLRVGGVIFFLP